MAESSATPLGNSDADREEMLDRMLTRLALCDDSKLQPLLSKLLPLTISSLSSQSLAVRKKVTTISLDSYSMKFSYCCCCWYYSIFGNFLFIY